MKPSLRVEFAFGTSDWTTWADGGTVWTDVTDYVQSIEITRGRNFEFDRFPAGRCKLKLLNMDRRFDRDYADSPYSGIDPMTPVRVVAEWLGIEHYLFLGFVEVWSDKASEILDGKMTVPCLDALSVLGLYTVTASYSEEGSGARVGNVLDDVGWPAGERVIDTGASTVPATELENTKALDHLLHVGEAEFGSVFIAKGGELVFHDRDRISTGAYIVPELAFGPDDLPYHGPITVDYTSSRIYNAGEATVAGSDTEINRENSTSVAKYGRRPFPGLANLLLVDETAAQDFVDFVVACYSDVVPRLKPLRFELPYAVEPPHPNDILWEPLLSMELRDYIEVTRALPVGENPTYQANVQQITMKIMPETQRWEVNLAITPAKVFAPWILGDATFGVLADTTFLGV